MLGLLPVAVIVVVLFGSFYAWARRQGLVAPAAAGGHGRGNVSLLTEAVAYVGAILVLAGAFAAVGERWDQLSPWGHVGLVGGGAALFLLAGTAVSRVHDAAIERLGSALWFVSSVGVAGAAGLAAGEVYGNSEAVTALTVGVATTVYSLALWDLRQRALQNVAVFAGLVATVPAFIFAVGGDSPPSPVVALSLWALGIAWAALSWRRLTEPVWVSLPLGVVLALLAPSFAVGDDGWMFAVAVLTSAGVMAASVPTRNVALLGLGTLATFGYVTALVVRYFRESLGVPAALAVTGLLILALAVVTAQLLRAGRPTR